MNRLFSTSRGLRLPASLFRCLLTCLALFALTAARADVLFDQMTNPSQTIFQSSWYAPDGSDGDQYIYDNFLIPGDSTVSEVWFVGTAMQNNFTVRFYTGYPGYPDAAPSSVALAPDETAANYISSYTFTASSSNPTLIPGTGLYQQHVVLPTPITFTGNTVYWIRIVSDGSFGWAQATHGRNNSHLTYISGLNRRLVYGGDLAFQLVGTPAVVPTYVIAATASPSNGGTVTGAGTFTQGDTVTLNATPSGSRLFLNWTESGAPVSTSATYTFTADRARTLKANFINPAGGPYVITAVANPTTGGNVGGANTFNAGSAVTLDSSAQDGVQLVNWTENGVIVSTAATYNFTATAHRNLSANFANPAQIYFIYGLRSPANTGSVTGTGGVGWATGNDNYNYGYFNGGVVVTLTATPPADYHFARWTKDGVTVGTSPTLLHVVVATKAITAVFEPDSPVLTLTRSPIAGGTVTGAGSYASGASVTSTATPAIGYDFASWTDGSTVVSTNPSYTQTLTNHRTLTANFIESYRLIALSAAPVEGGTVTGGGAVANGTTVALTATANLGYYFVNWTETGIEASALANFTFTGNSSRTLVANFAAVPVITILPLDAPVGNLLFYWPSAPNWILEESSNLTNWLTSSETIISDGGLSGFSVAAGPGSRFFRLRLP